MRSLSLDARHVFGTFVPSFDFGVLASKKYSLLKSPSEILRPATDIPRVRLLDLVKRAVRKRTARPPKSVRAVRVRLTSEAFRLKDLCDIRQCRQFCTSRWRRDVFSLVNSQCLVFEVDKMVWICTCQRSSIGCTTCIMHPPVILNLHQVGILFVY